MKLVQTVTFLVSAVLILVNTALAAENSASVMSTTPAASSAQNYSTSLTTGKKTSDAFPEYSVKATFSRSTSLVDFQDGSRKDAAEFKLAPSVGFYGGSKLATEVTYSQNLRDETDIENDFSDVPVSYSFKGTPLNWFKDSKTKIGYFLTAVVPASKISTKRDQLQTSVSGKINLSAAPKEDGVSAGVSVSAGRNFHAYEEDINGNVLNQYSSNQTLSLGYSYGSLSLSLDYIHRTRWTYRGNIKEAFELDEEIGYDLTKNINIAIGHTNAGAALKANGADSNIDFYNENSSMVYASLALSF
jgi:hypothetical protein